MNLTDLHIISTSFKSTPKMPTLFFGHGSPMNAIEENEFVANWRKVAASLPKPNAILCISAHWITRGTAVTAIQIDGVLHEFSSIKGVREDVTDIVLNVKNLAIKSSSSSSKKIILDIKGPKEVKAKDITLVPEIEILNPVQF